MAEPIIDQLKDDSRWVPLGEHKRLRAYATELEARVAELETLLGQKDRCECSDDEACALVRRVAELEAAVAMHRKERLPHMINSHDRTLWSFITPKP